MKFSATFTSLFAFSTLALADTLVRYDTFYDNPQQSTSNLTCFAASSGPGSHLPNLGSFSDFPNLGAAAVVGGWNSTDCPLCWLPGGPNASASGCGTCWALTYKGVTVNILGIDHIDEGFAISLETMNTLTGGQAQALGVVNATVELVDGSQLLKSAAQDDPAMPTIYFTLALVWERKGIVFYNQRTVTDAGGLSDARTPSPRVHPLDSIMKFLTSFTSLFALSTLALADTVRYDTTYDNASQSTSILSCFNGPDGSQYPTIGSIPDFPYIGATPTAGGWNSPGCGSCWEITYMGNTIFVVAVDHVDGGFTLSLEAMDALTNGQAEAVGVVNATVHQVDASQCGFPIFDIQGVLSTTTIDVSVMAPLHARIQQYRHLGILSYFFPDFGEMRHLLVAAYFTRIEVFLRWVLSANNRWDMRRLSLVSNRLRFVCLPVLFEKAKINRGSLLYSDPPPASWPYIRTMKFFGCFRIGFEYDNTGHLPEIMPHLVALRKVQFSYIRGAENKYISDDRTIFARLCMRMPRLRILDLQFLHIGPSTQTIIWPSDLTFTPSLEYLEKLYIPYPDPNDLFYAHLPSTLRILCLVDRPRYYHFKGGRLPVVNHYPRPTPVTAAALVRMLDQLQGTFTSLKHLERAFQADGRDIDLSNHIAATFPNLHILQIHRYRSEGEGNADIELSVKSIAQNLSTIRTLRHFRIYLNLPDDDYRRPLIIG
ncbi:hypothetical protein EVG20_g2979 [Dentipellis fragilis]|uniref:Expansin-like EG45 domain-containing protein n=1 Tax=Dentipellis fragilis TaxID=205917 RepID=A0A4Y9Z906_9AGAM|nr:hypothetical protein EVG20_g2979 [Dentipellis fragilis]